MRGNYQRFQQFQAYSPAILPPIAKRMSVLRILGRNLLVVLAGGLCAQALIVYAPGYNTDERELDPGLSKETREAMLRDKAKDSQLFPSYWRFLGAIAKGDFGNSRSLGRPVRELLTDRLPVTLSTLGKSLLLGWLLGLTLALGCSFQSGALVEAVGQITANLLLCVPAAVMALLLLIWADARTTAAIWVVSLALTPRIFRYTFNLLRQSYESPHVLLAKAKGIGPLGVLFRHVLPPAGNQLIALAGISVSVGLSVAIPAEVVLDVPGIGQLAWQAALSRDLPLLVNLTFIVALISVTANALSDQLLEMEAPAQ